MRRIAIPLLLASLGTVLSSNSPARAGMETVTAELNGSSLQTILNPSAAVTINLGDGNAPSVNYYPGVVNWHNATTSGGSVPIASSFTTFCIELTQDISPGTFYTYNLMALQDAPKPGTSQTQSNGSGSGMGTAKATKIEELWTGYYNTIATSSNPGNTAAAFQLDIWKIEYDYNTSGGTNSFSSGNFQASGNAAVISLAEGWLQGPQGLWSSDPFAPATNLVALDNPNLQDQVTQTATPVPPTIYLAAAGLVIVLVRRRKKPAATVPAM